MVSATRIEITAYGAAALERLQGVVAGLKSDDPMKPVTLLLPNNLAGVAARRFLAQSGIAGLFLATLPRLAEQLAGGLLAPRRPATRPIVAATWRTALSKAPGIFTDVAEHPSTIQALAAAHRELRDLSATALDKVAAASSLGPDLVRLHRHVTDDLAPEWYDETDLLMAASTRCSEDPSVVAELGALVLYLPQELTQAEARFVEALGDAAADLTVIVGLTDVRRADRAVRRSLERIGIDLPTSIAKNYPVATEVLNASDADDEVRCVVRDVVRSLERTPAHRIAVLYASATPYARLLHEHLAAAKIEVNGPGTRPVHERAIARTLLEVLALVDHDLPRGDLFRALANAPTRDFTGERIPVPQWERLSRVAGVVRGDDWDERLARYVESERRTAEQEQASEDPRPAVIRRAQYNAGNAQQLHSFAVELRRRLQGASQLGTWAEVAQSVLGLFQALLDVSSLPVEEQYAAVAVEVSLRGLSTLDELGTPASLSVLRDVLDLELQQSLPRVGTFGTGVLVAPLSASIGLAVDTVFVVGLSEDLYPGRVHEDALLPHRVREAAAPELASFRDRLDEKQRHLLAAFSAGSSRVVASFPRGDLRRSSRRLPTRWLLGTLRSLTGDHALAATEWDQAEYGDRMLTSASYAGSLTTATMPATEQDWQVRAATAGLSLGDGVVDQARILLRARASDEFTRFDGNLSGVSGLPDYALEDRVASPTSLESYASCPHAYFVERLLQVEPLEAPEDLLVISPLQVGNLIHNSLDAFVSRLASSLPGYGEPWSEEQRSLLLTIGADLAERFEAEGLTGHPRLWQRERLRILGDLLVLLADDERWRAEHDASVVASELRFGFDGEPPVEIPVPSGRVLLRGSADKVDLGKDGTIYVTDVKTGGFSRYEAIESDPVAAGTKLQLPVYAYAARARLGDPGTPVEASYWFVRKGGRRIPVPLTPEVAARYVDTLDVIVSSIAAGYFPAKAPEIPDFLWVQCPYCNPDAIGHSEVRARWERKRNDPTLERLVRLIDPSALPAFEEVALDD
ncbi:PD-(D/E)XK nuclease family protein [Kribbella sp. VKM Ac-2568]|uniref:PD-(D/E)XK nuclease family protein n=1 Tax=Kribbella sp. VKM Ac-2568 TaxID=2512219 RepID=UPI0010DE0381|nr:PD-(D/E)XK nuclease family protein [Kribbella sp. VKM Ac-2568]TCM39590.1 PD-(D/E)XK nuclease superfamily protein [Kribbella sp. VKM Ac-2568]